MNKQEGRMKKISKEFWIRDNYFSMLKRNHEYPSNLGTFQISTYENEECTQKVTISWEEPEKKIYITESEFNKYLDEVFIPGGRFDLPLLKQKLFGKTE